MRKKKLLGESVGFVSFNAPSAYSPTGLRMYVRGQTNEEGPRFFDRQDIYVTAFFGL